MSNDNKNQEQNPGGKGAAGQTAPTGDLATAAAVAGLDTTAVKSKSAVKYPAVGRVRSKVGDMVHLHQNVTVTADEKKISIDGFTIAQIEAGKWELVTD